MTLTVCNSNLADRRKDIHPDKISGATNVAGSETDGNLTEETSSQNDAPEEVDVMKCEVGQLNCRYSTSGDVYFEERQGEVVLCEKADSWWLRTFAFCLVSNYNRLGEFNGMWLYVNSQPLRQLLKDVIGDYYPEPMNVNDMKISEPYHSLFYYRTPLAEIGRERFKEDEGSLSQLNLLLSWIHKQFKADIEAYDACIAGGVKAIAYAHLWTLFPPNSIIHSEVFEQHQAFMVLSSWYDDGEVSAFVIIAYHKDWDGESLGQRKKILRISKYQGNCDLRSLGARPLDLHHDAKHLREYLLARGRKFEIYIGQHYMRYDGLAGKAMKTGYTRISIQGRIMIDCKTYHRLDPNDRFRVMPDALSGAPRRGKKRSMDGGEKISDDDAIIMNATVRGYSFKAKRFLEFLVDKISPIQWDTQCFNDLVLNTSTKKTIQALVSMHYKERQTVNNIVHSKGQGLVFVLHGPPGVGKTLTAECVAEYIQRPLYPVSAGELGVTISSLEESLTRIMEMAATWGAVLLIDEADIFLERRSSHDLHRNAMVSVFLRVLEYYTGILFLTTNRVNTFDEAFRSRIHVPIRYTELGPHSRLKIWRGLLGRVPGGVDVSEDGMRELTEYDLNGRQIKNIVKTTESLAAFDGVRLNLALLKSVTDTQCRFEQDLTSGAGIDYSAPGAVKKFHATKTIFL
ncbi:P-loop containing nucleoside triphosphate hydrolase protein [Xylaria venustula]|nr:P-loop containing nucleoside triphosphate hydrolase protein [Xylaria venustula]